MHNPVNFFGQFLQVGAGAVRKNDQCIIFVGYGHHNGAKTTIGAGMIDNGGVMLSSYKPAKTITYLLSAVY